MRFVHVLERKTLSAQVVVVAYGTAQPVAFEIDSITIVALDAVMNSFFQIFHANGFVFENFAKILIQIVQRVFEHYRNRVLNQQQHNINKTNRYCMYTNPSSSASLNN